MSPAPHTLLIRFLLEDFLQTYQKMVGLAGILAKYVVCHYIGAKLARLWREDTAVIHAEKETQARQVIRVMRAEVITFGVVFEIGHKVAGDDRPLALFVTVHAPPDATLVLLCKCRTLNINQRQTKEIGNGEDHKP